MKLDNNKDYGVNKKPLVFSKGQTWYFRSSDKAFAEDHSTDFQVGAYVTPKLTGREVKVAATRVSQNPGDYRVTVIQPRDGNIYPNGAVKIRVDHLFLGKTTNHTFDVEIPDDPAPPIAGTGPSNSRFSDEFRIRGASHGTGGTLTTEVIKLPPKRTDPLNRLYNFVRLKTRDPNIFDESGAPFDFRGTVNLTGQEPSFWRSSPAHGNGQRGTFWNWATVVGQPGSGFRGSQESTGKGTYGESETWHGTDYATDRNVTALGGLDRDLSTGLDKLADADRGFRKWQDKLNGAVAQYQQFKAGFASLEKLAGIYDTIASLMKSGAKLSQTAKELEKSIALETDVKKLAELVKQLQKVKSDLEKLQDQVTVAIDQRDKILSTIPSALKVNAPLNLVKTAASFLEALGKGDLGKLNDAGGD